MYPPGYETTMPATVNISSTTQKGHGSYMGSPNFRVLINTPNSIVLFIRPSKKWTPNLWKQPAEGLTNLGDDEPPGPENSHPRSLADPAIAEHTPKELRLQEGRLPITPIKKDTCLVVPASVYQC